MAGDPRSAARGGALRSRDQESACRGWCADYARRCWPAPALLSRGGRQCASHSRPLHHARSCRHVGRADRVRHLMAMRQLEEMPAEARRDIAVVLTDIDDTLTGHGRLPAKAYTALEGLKQAGFIVAPITGRPAGWCDLIARQWPVDGVVGENGAFYFRHDDENRKLTRYFAKSVRERADDA